MYYLFILAGYSECLMGLYEELKYQFQNTVLDRIPEDITSDPPAARIAIMGILSKYDDAYEIACEYDKKQGITEHTLRRFFRQNASNIKWIRDNIFEPLLKMKFIATVQPGVRDHAIHIYKITPEGKSQWRNNARKILEDKIEIDKRLRIY
jgi:hypothetical protein